MRRYLVVANQTLAGGHLVAKVAEYHAAGDCTFHVLVPATHPRDQLTWTEGEARAIAERRLEQAVSRFRELGAEADGEVGDDSPVQAVADVLAREEFDEIILSTLPPGASRWLKQELPRRVERRFGLPVTHVVAAREPASST